MIFGGKKKNWDDQYDQYYTQQDPEYGRRAKPLLWIHFAALATVAGVFLVIVGAVAGGVMIEKTLKSILTPVGLVWLLLTLLVYFCLVFKFGKTAIVAGLCWLLLTVGGNWWVANSLTGLLEQPYRVASAEDENDSPFDLLLILGGGTNMSPQMGAQLNPYGDRVVTAARLYHSGRAKKLVASGRQHFRNDPKDLHPNEEATRILKELKIPESDLSLLGGINTSEEIEELRKLLDSLPDDPQRHIGILTSAWHLPRAMSLAKEKGIQATGVPSNFLSQPYAPNPGIVIPSAENLQKTSMMMHEILGRWMGR